MDQNGSEGASTRSAARDGLAALAVILLTVGLIAFVIASLI